jgi:hypothetical protein
MSESNFFDPSDQDQARIESMLFAARNYVQVSDDLRPRVLEAAKEHCEDRCAERKLGGFTIAVLVLLLISPPMFDYLVSARSAAFPRSATEMQRRAVDLSVHQGVGTHWALAEVFSQWRMLQASRLGQSAPRMK